MPYMVQKTSKSIFKISKSFFNSMDSNLLKNFQKNFKKGVEMEKESSTFAPALGNKFFKLE
jgi:hypothetical protein